jgi:molybdate transport system substrate-binding protein
VIVRRDETQIRQMSKRILPLCVWIAVAALTLTLRAAEVTVFAAASLTDSLKDIAATYEKQSGDKIIFNFAASSLLARQIEEGAPTDVFFSADEAKMDGLAKKGLIVAETRKSRLSNTLVIVIAADSALKIAAPEDLATAPVKRIALADPKAVPAGIYAREFLEKRKLWAAVQDKVVPTENVRAALAAVESGDIEAGMVYKTDAAISKKVKVACEIPANEGPAISYPVAVVKASRNIGAARNFVVYLNAPDSAKVFQSYGFIVLK